MKWKDSAPREYYRKYKKVDVKNGQGWFEVYRLPGNIYAICEPQHFQEVNAYLILGRDKSLLLDTGMGICDIRSVVEELYQGELMVVNSHFHFDHVGNNYKFDEVYIFDEPYAKAAAESGLPKEALGNQLDEDMFLFGYPAGFSPEEFHIPPYKTRLIGDGYIFDLGDRSLKVIHTPGHSNDSIMLFDSENGILFTGDSFYLGALYAHFDCGEFGRSSLEEYLKSMRRLPEEYPNVKALYCSHNDFIADPIKLTETAEALQGIIDKHMGRAAQTKAAHSYLEDASKLMEYGFDGFSIVVKENA